MHSVYRKKNCDISDFIVILLRFNPTLINRSLTAFIKMALFSITDKNRYIGILCLIYRIRAGIPALTIVLALTATIICPCAAQRNRHDIEYKFKTENKEFDSIASLVLRDEATRTHDGSTSSKLGQMQKIADATHNSVLAARAALWTIRNSQLNARPDTCIARLEKVRNALPRSYDYDYACLSYQLAGNYCRISNYFNTYQLLNEAIPIFEKYEDYYFLGNAHLLMGLTYSDIGDLSSSLSEIEKADRYYRECGYPVNRISYFKAGMAKDNDDMIRLYRRSIAEGPDDPGMSIQACEKIASLYLKKNLPDSAISYIEKGERMRLEKSPDSMLLKILLNIRMGEALYNKKQYDRALTLLKETEEIASHYSREYWEPSIHKYLSNLYEIKGDKEQAHTYLKKYIDAYEQQINSVIGQEIPKARARDAINRQKEIEADMEQKQKNAHNRFITTLLILVAVSLTAAGVLIYIWQRSKMRKIENRELRSNLEQEMIIKRLNLENFERDMKQKECEISSSVLLVSNKNDVLQQIGQITRKYSDEGRIPKEFVNQVNALVSDSIKGDDEWTRFKMHFDTVHPDFFKKLKEASNELTENDLRLCAYIRIGMRAKDIASMLSVTPASVNSNRYRLRRKLSLTKEDSLDDYIRKI